MKHFGCIYLIISFLLLLPPLPGKAEVHDIPVAIEQTHKGPATKFDKQTHDFGRIRRNEVKTHTFYVTNTGDEPLLIYHVETGCGCTTTSYTTKSIKPGKRGKVTVEFNPASVAPGAFRKVITVYVNTIHAYTRLFVKGEIVEQDK